jgi:hypothetical protein
MKLVSNAHNRRVKEMYIIIKFLIKWILNSTQVIDKKKIMTIQARETLDISIHIS